jgi:L-cystine transport system ATP-binding protein
MTVLENVMDPLVVVQRKSKDEARAIALEEIDRVGLSSRKDH